MFVSIKSPYKIYQRVLFYPKTSSVSMFFQAKSGFSSKCRVTNLKTKDFAVKNVNQLYKTFFIFMVGKQHCVEAIEKAKNISFCLARLLSRQCKVHTSQKFCQSFQKYFCYSRMWGEDMAHKMMHGLRKSLLASGKYLLLSAVCVTPYDWKVNKISDEKLGSCIKEFDSVYELCSSTLYCFNCHKRQVVHKQLASVDYCMCKGSAAYVDKTSADGWEPFLEKENIIVWRKKHPFHSHLYCYKVFGRYADLSVSAFMETQLNPSFRQEWDGTVLKLEIVDSDPETNSDLMYWLVKFPRFFANRDYVFNRRFHVYEKKKEVVIMSEITSDSTVAAADGVHRVTDYWSAMVLKANGGNFHEPGMSYTLTYFDDPGTKLPSAVTNFAATQAFPDFLANLYEAAKTLQERWKHGEDVYLNLPMSLRRPSRDLKKNKLLIPSREQEFMPIEEDSLSSLPSLEITESQNDPPTPKKVRDSIINLLEALELVTPEPDFEDVPLTTTVEQLALALGLGNARTEKLVNRLKKLQGKTRSLLENAAKRRQESIQMMTELERRRRRRTREYDDGVNERLIITLLQMALHMANEDVQRRTGKAISIDADDANHKKANQNNKCDKNGHFDIDSDIKYDYEANGDQAFAVVDNSGQINIEEQVVSTWWDAITFAWWWKNTEDSHTKFSDNSLQVKTSRLSTNENKDGNKSHNSSSWLQYVSSFFGYRTDV